MTYIRLLVLAATLLAAATDRAAQIRRTRTLAIAPPGPDTVKVSPAAGGALVSWSDTPGAVQYQVLRGPDATSLAAIAPPVAASSFLDAGVPPGATVYYQVAAIQADGRRGSSAPVAYTAPAVPMVAGGTTGTRLKRTAMDGSGAVAMAPAPMPITPVNPKWMRAALVPGVPGAVDLTWDVPAGPSGFRVAGPGIAAGAVVVPGNAIRVLGVGAGLNSWRVASTYPGNVMDTTTAASASAIVRVLPPRSLPWLSKSAGAGNIATAVAHSNAHCGGNAPACGAETFDQALSRFGTSASPGGEASYLNHHDLGTVYRGTRQWSSGDALPRVLSLPGDLQILHASRRTKCNQFQVSRPFQQSFQRTVCWTSSGIGKPVTMIVTDPAGTQFLVFNATDEETEGYGPDGTRRTYRQWISTALDGEGEKFLPFSCMSCHGGTYDPQSRLVQGASLLPIDPSLVVPIDAARDEPGVRQLNAIVSMSNPSLAVRRYIQGLYGGQVAVAGAAAVRDFVPQSWHQQGRSFYLGVVRRNCVMCHLAGPPHLDFTNANNFLGNAALVHKSVCTDRSMPHAEVPFLRFWLEDTGALYVPGLLATLLGFPSC